MAHVLAYALAVILAPAVASHGALDLKRGYGWKQDATAMKYLYKSTDQAER